MDYEEGTADPSIYGEVTLKLTKNRGRRGLNSKCFISWVIVNPLLLGLLFSTFVDERLKKKRVLSYEVWIWSSFLVVVLVLNLLIRIISILVVWIIERTFYLKKNAVYYTHCLKASTRMVIWVGVVVGIWELFFLSHPHDLPKVHKIMHFFTQTLRTVLLGIGISFLKTLLVTRIASHFQLETFFARIKDAIFDHYILQQLSKPPTITNLTEPADQEVRFLEGRMNNRVRRVDWATISQMNSNEAPLWTMQLLVHLILGSTLSTVSNNLEQVVTNEPEVQTLEQTEPIVNQLLTREEEAVAAASRVFSNILGESPSYIVRSDLRRFLTEEDTEKVFPFFELNEREEVTLEAFTKWVIKLYRDRRTLQHALKCNQRALKRLNGTVAKIVTGPLILIAWLLMTNIMDFKSILLIFSPLLLPAVVGPSGKTAFESLIFVYITHPFDVGDLCCIDGHLMVVEQINFSSTVFKKLEDNHDPVFISNTEFGTKHISNYHRDREPLGVSFELSIKCPDAFSVESRIRQRIKEYVDQNPHLWRPEHLIKNLELGSEELRLGMNFTHRANFYDLEVKTRHHDLLMSKISSIVNGLDQAGLTFKLEDKSSLVKKDENGK